MLKPYSYAIYLCSPLEPIGMLPYKDTMVKIIRPFTIAKDTGRTVYIIEMVDGYQALVTNAELLPHVPSPSWSQIEASTGFRPMGLKI